MSFQEFQECCRACSGAVSKAECNHGTYSDVYAACLASAKHGMKYGLDEAENAVYEVLRSYHSMTPDAKLEIHHSVMASVKRMLAADNGGYPLYIEEG